MKNKDIVIRAGIMVLAIIVIAYLSLSFQGNENQSQEINFDELKKGDINAIENKQIKIIDSPAEWSNLWNKMFPTEMIAPISLEDKMIIAVFQGQKPTAGYSIEITKIIEKSDFIDVYVKESIPAENCILLQVITSPYHIVLLQSSDKQVKFIYNEDKYNCS